MIRAEDAANCQLRNTGLCLWTAAPSVISTWLQRILQEVLVFQGKKKKKGGKELTKPIWSCGSWGDFNSLAT